MKRTLTKGDKGEQIVIDELNKNTDEQYLINNLILLGDNGISHQFDHILIRHNGVFVIETKNYYGKIKGTTTDSMWTKTYPLKGRTKIEKFHNPIKQNQAHIRFLKKIIGRNASFFARNQNITSRSKEKRTERRTCGVIR